MKKEKNYNLTADILENDKNYIISNWLLNVRAEIPIAQNKTDAEVVDHLGSFINILISALRTNQAVELMNSNRELSKFHGFQRSQFPDYTLEQILQEYHILRETLFDYLITENSNGLTEIDRKILHSFIDNGIHASINEFVHMQLEARGILVEEKYRGQIINEQEKVNISTIELQKSLKTLSIINRVGQNLTSKLDLDKIIQSVTDAARDITGAEFGAFFYASRDEKGEKVLCYTFSDPSRVIIDNYLDAKSIESFHPTFAGFGTIRTDDISVDPRFGKNLSFYGLPRNISATKSYLGVSVVSRNGEVLGGLFLGHKDSGIFTKQDEEIVEGLAAQAAIAMENGKLYLKLQDSLKDRDTFLSIASHELKTPLTSLTLQSQMRRRQLAKGDTDAFQIDNLKKMFESDIKQLTSLNRLIDDMLDISRMRTGRLELNKEIFDLNNLVHEIVERFQSQIEEACDKFTFDSQEVCLIEADPYRIEQVIVNLLTNAMKYGKGKPLEIKVFSDHLKEKAFLCVSDNGMGVSEVDQERIFSRFERAVSPNEVSGLGLGLAIVKDIVEAHHGEIHLESEVGVGSTFTIALKLIRAN